MSRILNLLVIAAVIFFDGSFVRLANQIVGPFCMIIAAYGLSEVTPVTTLFNLNTLEVIFYMFFGLLTAYIGWGKDLSHLKHWWP